MKALRLFDYFTWRDQVWQVIAADGAVLTLQNTATSTSRRVRVDEVLGDATFSADDGSLATMHDVAALEGFAEEARARAEFWYPHVHELVTGRRPGTSEGSTPDPRYALDVPAGVRERAKAAELAELGHTVSTRWLRHLVGEYRSKGVRGLVDQRTIRDRRPPRTDPRIIELLTEAVKDQEKTSTRTRTHAVTVQGVAGSQVLPWAAARRASRGWMVCLRAVAR